MRNILCVLALLPILGCHTVVRDEATYKLEVNFMEQAAVQQAESLTTLVKTYCKCDAEKKFTTPDCEMAAKKAVLASARVPWHKAMMLYNARLLTVRPPVDPPVVPSTSTLCP